MGNQLTATAAVDLANVSGDLELVTPLGAEGRNYFASFHCLHYTPVVPGATPHDASRGGSQPDVAGSPTLRHSAAFPVSGSTLTMPNAPCYTSGFMTAATRGGAAAGGAYAMGDHLQRTTPLVRVTSGASVEFHSTGPSSPASALPTAAATTTTTAVTAAGAAGGQTWVVAAPGAASLGGRGRGRGRGRGGGSGAERALTFAALCDGVAAIAAAASTTQVSAAERAAWHQARWRQRLPVADRPWRVVPSSLRLEAAYARPSSADAVMESWCRDCSGSAGGGNGGARSSGLRSNARGFTPDSGASRLSSPALPAGPYASAYTTAASATGSIQPAGAARHAASLDTVVAGLSGEWRSNYGNYVQLLLRGGAGAGLSSSSSAAAAAAPGGLVVSAPHGSLFPASSSSAGVSSFLAASTGAAAAAALAHYLVEDVVTKVFVRTPEDPGQAYFLRYVRQMIDNAGEQLRVVDSTLPRATPRNCLWYTHVYEGEGFCVLQRPYVAFTLRERLAARPGWTAGERLFVVYQLLEAVANLHETYGITHGDIKPNNVLVQSTGVVTLCDMAPFKPRRMPLDNPLLFDYYYDTDENRACYVAPEKFSDEPLPTPPLESRTRGSATYNVSNVNFDGHTASMDVFSTACVVLHVYAEEDPLTLAQVLALRHLSSSDARERAVRPVLRDAGVPLPLQPLLLSMLCATADERPSAREVLRRGLAERVFPAFFPYLYGSVWPDLLTTTADARLLRLHGGLEGLLRHCDALTAAALMEAGDLSSSGRRDWEAGVAVPPGAASGASATRALAVSLLLPTLLQTLHASQTSDEATYRGLLCLRHCAAHCDFACLVDAVLPHVLLYVNNDAHMYGPATRLVALRLLCRIAETIARHLTQRAPHTPAAPVSEEQWALLEHLVLPCVYDVLRQGEQESTAVLVEVATCLPRLLLLTRCVTERRQVLYGAEAGSGVATSAGGAHPTTAPASRPPSRHRRTQSEEAMAPAAHRTVSAAAPPRRSSEPQQRRSAVHGQSHEGEGDFGERSGGSLDGNLHRRTMSSPVCTSTNASPPPQPTAASTTLVTRSNSGSVKGDAPAGSTLERGGGDADRGDSVSGESAGSIDAPASSDDVGDEGLGPRTDTRFHRHGGIDFGAAGASEVRRSNASGTQQYLVQLRCLLNNGWGMLQTLYNHPCVPVAVAVMQQSASTVAAFLGEERVMADLIPLLTTALVAPMRVQRVLYPQAILLHALLQPSPQRQPPSKTLRLFVEEGLRHTDDACLKATLDSLAVVLRCRRLPPAEAMALVHQTLPLLVESRLWLREAACGVVEAAAQTYTASDVAQHLEYAVRPLLLLPVPLARLRRYAATAIRAELATTTTSGADGSVRGTGLAALEEPRHLIAGSSLLFSEDGVDGCDGAPIVLSPLSAQAQMAPPQQHQQQWPSLTLERHPAGRDHAATCTEVLPAVVAVTRSYAAGPAPTFLHGLPASELGSGGGGSRTLRMTRVAASWPDAAEEGAAGCGDEPPQGARADGNLAYRLSAREAARVQRERQTCSVPVAAATTGSAPATIIASGRLEPAPAPLPGPSTSAAAAAVGALHRRPLSPPHSTDVAPVPVSLPPPSHVSRPSLRLSSSATAQHNGSYATAVRGTPPSAGPAVSALMGSQPAGSASTALHLTMANMNATPLRPVAAALSTASAHTGAVYATAPSPGPSGVVVSAGARGEAFVWQVTSTHTGAAHVRELHLVERIPPVSSRAADHAYTACQWMPATASARRDSALAASSFTASPTSSAAAATAVVALASTDGAVRLLDVERNAWVSSAFVGGGCDDGAGEGGLTGLALQDRGLLLVTTAAGGLHVVDARCRGSSRSAASSTSGDSVWRTRLSPMDGAPSCVCPLYAGDKACAAVVGTYGGAVCLYDLRYQVCAQRVVLMEDWPSRAAAAVAPGPLAITTACVDPLSTLSASCRPPTWEAVPCTGPSMLLGTTTGAVYRLLLESGAYWQAFQCDHARRRRAGGPDAAVRAMLTQPTHGAVFTGGEDGFIRSWSTDKPETSHTLCCVPYVTSPYTVVRTAAAERAVAASGGSASSRRGLMSVTVREGTTQAACALPRHASDAILSLCTVRTAAAPAAAWLADGGAGEGGEAAYLLSGSRDGTLTLWDNEPVSRG